MSQLKVLSPLSGQVWPLERVPDPVFAQKMVGDGLSIDPTDGLLLAACDGRLCLETGYETTDTGWRFLSLCPRRNGTLLASPRFACV